MDETSQNGGDRIGVRTRHLEVSTTLSPKEAKVQALKESGHTHEEIADEMGIAKGTVDSHAHRIAKKSSLAYHTVKQLLSVDELEPWDFAPLVEELVEMARGPLEDETIQADLETVVLGLDDDTFHKDGWPCDYDREKNLLVTE